MLRVLIQRLATAKAWPAVTNPVWKTEKSRARDREQGNFSMKQRGRSIDREAHVRSFQGHHWLEKSLERLDNLKAGRPVLQDRATSMSRLTFKPSSLACH